MSRLLARIAIPKGEGRCFAVAGTERALEIELDGRVLRTTWDPRETGVIHYASVASWTTPPGVALTPEERELVLDGMWALRAHAGGIRAILVYEVASSCHVARRWDRGEDGQLVDVHADYVDVFELGRTARIPATPTGGGVPPEATVRVAEARWAHPAGAIVTDGDRARLAAELARSGADDQRIASFTWRLRPV